jgi:hypothetical protein
VKESGRPNSKSERKWRSFAVITIAACLLASFLVETACAQAIPRRIEQLQTYRGQITPPPLSPADQLRQDIIQATNPQSGTVNVGILSKPRPLWPTGGAPNVSVGVSSGPNPLWSQGGQTNVNVGAGQGPRRLWP